MTRAATRPTVAELVDDFAAAPPDRLQAEFLRLVGALWSDGKPTELAVPAVPALVAELAGAADRRGHLVLLLGLLAEAEYPATDGELATAVRAGLDRYLQLWHAEPDVSSPLALALLYLLGHFPDDRPAILAAVAGRGLGPDDQSRLERNLQRLDPGNVVLGRVWPSPSEWTLTDAERAFDQTWIAALAPAQLVATWRSDTRMLLGYSGAKAYWALVNGARPVGAPAGAAGAASAAATGPSTSEGEFPVAAFQPHAAAFRCPVCQGGLEFDPAGVRCAGCGTAFPTAGGVLDLTGETGPSAEDDNPNDVLKNAAAMHSIGLYYEAVLRPAFLRLMGSNWDGAVSPTGEDAYLVEHATAAGGPLLDLAAGAGRWTEVLARTLGSDRVVALDLNPTMLTWLRGRLPDLPAVRASALTLPFADASMGGVNCWNALQAMPDPAAAIAEVGRVLRPGGTFTLLTFRWGADQVYRYFQNSFSGPGFPTGMPLFELDEIRGWLAAAGLAVRSESTPGTFVFVTAQRAG
jgi:SAM-dependent methyltransferase